MWAKRRDVSHSDDIFDPNAQTQMTAIRQWMMHSHIDPETQEKLDEDLLSEDSLMAGSKETKTRQQSEPKEKNSKTQTRVKKKKKKMKKKKKLKKKKTTAPIASQSRMKKRTLLTAVAPELYSTTSLAAKKEDDPFLEQEGTNNTMDVDDLMFDFDLEKPSGAKLGVKRDLDKIKRPEWKQNVGIQSRLFSERKTSKKYNSGVPSMAEIDAWGKKQLWIKKRLRDSRNAVSTYRADLEKSQKQVQHLKSRLQDEHIAHNFTKAQVKMQQKHLLDILKKFKALELECRAQTDLGMNEAESIAFSQANALSHVKKQVQEAVALKRKSNDINSLQESLTDWNSAVKHIADQNVLQLRREILLQKEQNEKRNDIQTVLQQRLEECARERDELQQKLRTLQDGKENWSVKLNTEVSRREALEVEMCDMHDRINLLMRRQRGSKTETVVNETRLIKYIDFCRKEIRKTIGYLPQSLQESFEKCESIIENAELKNTLLD
eukprot:g1862.t1